MTKFQDLTYFTDSDIDAALGRNDPDELRFVSITLALSCSDRSFVQEICVKLASHEHGKVRGNAVMSLGHLARRFRELDEKKVKPVVESALHEADEYMHTHAKSAADEIHQFLGWNIAGHVYG